MCTLIHPRKASSRRRGFTFLEIMLVVVIIGIMMAIVAPRFAGQSEKARRTAAKTQIESIKTALGLFEVKTGDFPTTEQGLEALVKRPSDVPEDVWVKCMDEVPKDPWRNNFIYRYPGEHGADYDLISVGRDKQEGTKDDVTNFSSENKEK